MMFEQMYSAMPAIQANRLRPLAITSKARSPLLPDVPTMAEQGFPAVEVLNWQGLIGPKGMAPERLIELQALSVGLFDHSLPPDTLAKDYPPKSEEEAAEQ
jgi:tripartite-type tricarboxylate transporter receptor subunit TctC